MDKTLPTAAAGAQPQPAAAAAAAADGDKGKDKEKDNNSRVEAWMKNEEEDQVDWMTRRRNFLREQSAKIRENYSKDWQRRIMIGIAGIEAKVRHRKIPPFDTSNPGVIYVGDRRFGGESFFYFTPDHPMRRGAIRITTDPWYNKFSTVLLVIHILPAVVAEPGVPRHRFSDSIADEWSWLLLLADRFLLLYFAIELGVTFMAYGFLRTLANWFRLVDLLAIVIAVMVDALPHDYMLNGENVAKYFIALNSLRIFRVGGRIEGMRKLMIVLKSCIPTLLDVAMLLGALVFSFVIVGLTFFRDAQHNRCVNRQDPTDITHTCVPDFGGGPYATLNGRQVCEPGYNCTAGQPPVSQWGNFDNVVNAFFSIVQILTLDDWYVLSAQVMDGMGPSVYAFFIVGALLGAFWAMNLILAVVTDAFSRFHAQEKRLKNRKKKRQRQQEDLLRLVDDQDGGGANNDGDGENYDEELRSLDGGGSSIADPMLRKGGKNKRKQQQRGHGSDDGSSTFGGGSSDDGDGPPLVDDDGDPILDPRAIGGTKGTHPWFKRKLRLWMRHLNAASTASLLAGIQTVDVRSMMDQTEQHTTLSRAATTAAADANKNKNRGIAAELAGDEDMAAAESRKPATSVWRPGSRYTGPPLLTPIRGGGFSGGAAAAAGGAGADGSSAATQFGDGDAATEAAQQSKKPSGDMWEATGLFDDSDLVQLAASATLAGREQVAATTRFRNDAARRTEVSQRVKGIEQWARGMPAADQLSSIPDTEPHWDITEDEMWDPLLVVPDASDSVGTKGIHFYPRAVFRPLGLFERYQLAAERANRGEAPDEQSSEDDMDMGFVSEKEMSFVNLRRQLKRAKARALKAARLKKAQIAAAAAAAGNSFSGNSSGKKSKSGKADATDSGAEAGLDEDGQPEQNTWKEQLYDWWATLRASYRSYPFGTLVRMVHESTFWNRLVMATVVFTAALLSINYYGAPNTLTVAINIFTAFNDVVLIVDMIAWLYFGGFFFRTKKKQQQQQQQRPIPGAVPAAASTATGAASPAAPGAAAAGGPGSLVPLSLAALEFGSPFGKINGVGADGGGAVGIPGSPASPSAQATMLAIQKQQEAEAQQQDGGDGGDKPRKITAALAIDILVGIQSIVDLAIVVPGFGAALRGIRGVRLIKLAKNFTLLHEMINKMRSASYYFVSLLAVALSFVMALSTIGRHVFDGWMPEVENCYVTRYDFACNKLKDCVFVTSDEWADDSIVYTDLQSRVFLPRALANMTVAELDLFRTNQTLLATAPLVAQYLNDTAGYRCRQFRNWGELAATDRLTFNSPVDAFLTVFNALTKDNFSSVEYRFMQISPWTALFFLFILIFGSYLLISLLIAILLVHFSDLEVKKEAAAGNNKAIGDAAAADGGGGGGAADDGALPLGADASSVARSRARGNSVSDRNKPGLGDDEEDPETWAQRPKPGGVTHPPSNIASQPIVREEIPDGAPFRVRFSIKARYWARRLLKALCDVADPLIHRENLRGNSFFLFSPKSGFRLKCCDLISGRFFPFEQTIVLCAMAHCVTTFIMGDTTVADNATMATILTVDWVMVALSVVDLLARCIAQGAVLGEYSFFSSRYENKVDFATILLSVLASIYRLSVGATLVGVVPDMFFRAFRPMRIVIRSRGMKNVALAVYKTLPAMGRVAGLGAALIWMLSIVTVEYFGGVLQRCSDGSDRSLSECNGTFQSRTVQIINDAQVLVLINETRSFRNSNEYNFDNIFFAFNSLTSLAIASQWTNVVFSLADSPEVPGGMPIRNSRRWTVWIVMSWIVIGNFVLLNIFVGTIVDNFSRYKQALAGALFKTPEEVELNQIQVMLKQTRVKKALSVPEVPFLHRHLNYFCFVVISSAPFLYWTRIVTLFDMVAIATQHYQQSDAWMVFQEAACRAIAVALWVEVLLKVGISGPVPYLKIWFNRIDFLNALVVGSESLLYIFWAGYRENAFLNTLRIVSSFRLVRESKSFRSLLKSGLRALPALSNVGSLVLLVFFMASFCAMGLFQNVRTITNSEDGTNLDHDYNFLTIPRAMITMFLVATLDNWGDVMQAASAEPPNCVEGKNCGEPVVAQIFFLLYCIMVGFIMINLFITVVLENFSESVLVPQYVTERLRDVNSFRQLWVTFDPSGRQVISAKQFMELLFKLPGPRFRLKRLRGEIKEGDNVSTCSWATEDKERYAAHSAIGLLKEPRAAVLPTLRDFPVAVTMPNQEVLFSDALQVIGEKIFHISLLNEEEVALKRELRKTAREYADGYTVLHYYAASRIQDFVRMVRLRQQQPALLYKNTILWDQILKPLFKERWKHNAESIFKTETPEEAAMYRKQTLSRGLGGGDKNQDDDDDDDDADGAGSAGGSTRNGAGSPSGGRRKRGGSKNRRGKDRKRGGDDERGGSGLGTHIRPLLELDKALGSKMVAVEEEVEEDLSWLTAVPDVASEGSSWADDEGEQAWLPAAAISGQRTIRSVGVAPECRRHGGVFELVSVDELIARRRRERDFLARFPPTVRQRVQTMPARTRPKWKPSPIPEPTLSSAAAAVAAIAAGAGGVASSYFGAAAPSAATAATADNDMVVEQSALGARVARKGGPGGGVGATSAGAASMAAAIRGLFSGDGPSDAAAVTASPAAAAQPSPIAFDDSDFTVSGAQRKRRREEVAAAEAAAAAALAARPVRGKDGWLLSQVESKKPPPPRPIGADDFSPFRSLREQQQQQHQQLSADEYRHLFGSDSPPGAPASSSAGAADMDEALLELEQRIQQERLRSASRLSDVAAIRSHAPQLASDAARQRAAQSSAGTGSANVDEPAASSGLRNADQNSSSLAAVRSSIFSSNRLRNWNHDATASLVSATQAAAFAVPMGAWTGVDPDLAHLLPDDDKEKDKRDKAKTAGAAIGGAAPAAAAGAATPVAVGGAAATAASGDAPANASTGDAAAHVSFADAPAEAEVSRGTSLFKKVGKAAFAIAHVKK